MAQTSTVAAALAMVRFSVPSLFAVAATLDRGVSGTESEPRTNSTDRALITPARRGKVKRRNTALAEKEKDITNRHVAMNWAEGRPAQRLNRVFNRAAQASM